MHSFAPGRVPCPSPDVKLTARLVFALGLLAIAGSVYATSLDITISAEAGTRLPESAALVLLGIGLAIMGQQSRRTSRQAK
jgi:hypothetical protein